MFVKNITTEQLVIGAPAKVNLFLEVLNKRPDGYHNIYSLFQAVSLFDRLTVRRIDGDTPQLGIGGIGGLEVTKDNLVYKAFDVVRKRYGFTGSIEVHLEKNIPVAAGLGGGSADAAAILMACNELFELGADMSELADLSLEIGSDCPFFFSTGQALVTGRGEQMTPTDFPRDYWLVLVTPSFGLSTAESYAALKRGLTEPPKRFSFGGLRTLKEFIEALQLSANDFEGTHLESHPELVAIRGGLLDLGARLVRMSGSGPTIFGIFEGLPDFDWETWGNREHWRVNAVKPIALPTREH
jgi:4-diphosphocytidyl-2C-methyl-D-erythritol kinase